MGISCVFVQPYPSTTADPYRAPKIQNDFHPVWAPDGNAIFYMPNAVRFVRVPVMTPPTLTFGRPEEWPATFVEGELSTQVRDYDVLPGDRFVAVVPAMEEAGPSAPQEIRVVLNWTEELKLLVPVK